MTGMFPELKEEVEKIECDSMIMEGEAVAYDEKSGKFLPFQLTISRKRKHGVAEKAKEVPLTFFGFDLLYLNGKSMLEKPFSERRSMLQKLIFSNNPRLKLITQVKADSAADINRFFAKEKKKGLEGIMVKMKEAPYQAGSRGFHWIKYKREETAVVEDSIDVVVLGYYFGKGKRADFGIGALLVGVYNKEVEMFESIAKIGTGIKDEEFRVIKRDCDQLKIKSKPKNVVVPQALNPDVWVSPQIVAVVLSDEITRSPMHAAGSSEGSNGFALRFPRLTQWKRKDKSPVQITSVSEISKMYKHQY